MRPRSFQKIGCTYVQPQRLTGICADGGRCPAAATLSSQFHEHLASISPREQAKEGVHRLADAVTHRFLIPDLSRSHQWGHLRKEIRIGGGMVEDDEALHLDAPSNQ